MITVYTGNTTMSDVRFRCGSADWAWRSTIPVSTVLTINCGTKTVLLGTANAYAHFQLGSNHATADWLALEPGNNTITLDYSGNGNSTATVQLAYPDGWY